MHFSIYFCFQFLHKSLQSSILEFGGVVAIDVFVETVNCIRTVFRSTLDNNEMFL